MSSPIEVPGRRQRTVRTARVIASASWWVFVVARLLAEVDIGGTGGLPRRYADVGGNGPGSIGQFDIALSVNAVSIVTVIALAVTVIAAMVEAAGYRRWRSGALTVLAPIIGAAVILIALYERAGHPAGGRWGLPAIAVLALVLLGVAVREGRTRRWAPHPTRPL